MARDISILFTLKDKFSNSLKNISKEQGKFKKDLMASSIELKGLYDKKRTLQLDNKAATKSIKDTAKNAKQLGTDLRATMEKSVEAKVKTQFQLDAINKKIKETEKGLNKVNKTTAKPTVKLNDQASSKLSAISKTLGSLGKTALIGGGAVVGLGGAGIYQSLKVSGQLEQTQIAFETMLKNKAAGQKLMADLSKFAIDTPFQMQDLATNSQYAIAMGFKGSDILSLLTDAGNAASGTGKGVEGVENIIRALGQMQQKGKVSAQEINQLAENGIGAWGYIAKVIGKTTAETMKLAENGLLPAEQSIKAIRKGMNQDYSGMMVRQSKTLFGLLSSLKDFGVLNVLKPFGDGIREGIQPALISLIDSLTQGGDKLETMQEKLKSVGRTIGNFVSDKTNNLTKYFKDLFGNDAFKNADLGGKAKIVLNDMYTSMKSWFDGGGGNKVRDMFKTLADNATSIMITALTDAVPKFIILGSKIGGAIVSGITSSIGETVTKNVGDQNFLQNKSLDERFALDKGSTIGRWGILGGISKDEFKKSKEFGAASKYFDRQITNGFKTKEELLKENPWAKGVIPGFAYGKKRVPYNGYPALLHEGEKVQTKQEANRENKTGNIIINMNGTVIREESDIKKLAYELALAIYSTSMNMGVRVN